MFQIIFFTIISEKNSNFSYFIRNKLIVLNTYEGL